MGNEKRRAAASILGNVLFIAAVVAAIGVAAVGFLLLAKESPGVAVTAALVVLVVVLVRRLPKRS